MEFQKPVITVQNRSNNASKQRLTINIQDIIDKQLGSDTSDEYQVNLDSQPFEVEKNLTKVDKAVELSPRKEILSTKTTPVLDVRQL